MSEDPVVITDEGIRDAICHCATDGVTLSQAWLLAALEELLELRGARAARLRARTHYRLLATSDGRPLTDGPR